MADKLVRWLSGAGSHIAAIEPEPGGGDEVRFVPPRQIARCLVGSETRASGLMRCGGQWRSHLTATASQPTRNIGSEIILQAARRWPHASPSGVGAVFPTS